MPLIVTPGSATANSFVSIADATAFLVGRPDAAVFTDATTRLKEAWLIQATNLLARRVGWLEERANPLELVLPLVQALPLPMVGQVDAYGELLGDDVIPPLVEEATALLALALAQEARDGAPASSDIARLDVYQQVSITYRSGTTSVRPRQIIPWEVWDLLRLYGRIPLQGRHMPVVRGQG